MGNETILKTIDGGTTWTDVSTGTVAVLLSVCFPDADTGYAVGINPFMATGGVILKTTDGGDNWSTLSAGTFNGLYSVDFTGTETGFAVGMFGMLLKTINGGTTWTNYPSGTSNTFSSVFFPDNNTGYVAGSMGTIFKTLNGGNTWLQIPSGTEDGLFSIYFSNADTGYVTGIFGTIIKTSVGGTFPVGTAGLSNTSNRLNIYPNPSSGAFTIETSEISGHDQLSILNSGGTNLFTCQITGPKTQIDVTNLPGGVYFVRLTNDKLVVTGKYVKL
jgi:hypothetical protein